MVKSSVPLDVYQAGLTGPDLHLMLRDGRVLALDYPVRPRVRNFVATRGRARLHRIFANGTLRYRECLESWHSLTPFFSTIPLEPTGDERTPFWLNGRFPILDPIRCAHCWCIGGRAVTSRSVLETRRSLRAKRSMPSISRRKLYPLTRNLVQK